MFGRDICWEFSQNNARQALRVLGIDVKCTGLDLVKNFSSTGCIIVSNHRSWFDSLALSSVLPFRTHFVAKKSYFSVPVLGQWLNLYQHIPIDYTSSTPLKLSSLKFIKNFLNSGHIIAIYPEGTRSLTRDLLPFKRGAWWLGFRNKISIIEAQICGSEKVWPKGASIFELKAGTIFINFNNSYSVVDDKGLEVLSKMNFGNLKFK